MAIAIAIMSIAAFSAVVMLDAYVGTIACGDVDHPTVYVGTEPATLSNLAFDKPDLDYGVQLKRAMATVAELGSDDGYPGECDCCGSCPACSPQPAYKRKPVPLGCETCPGCPDCLTETRPDDDATAIWDV